LDLEHFYSLNYFYGDVTVLTGVYWPLQCCKLKNCIINKSFDMSLTLISDFQLPYLTDMDFYMSKISLTMLELVKTF